MLHGPPRLLHTLDRNQLAAAAADRRWPKWSTMCQLRLVGNPVLNGVCVTPDSDATTLRNAIVALAETTGTAKLMVRSDGGVETRAYYRGGNSLLIHQIESHAADLLAAGRAVILLEPTNRFTNQLSVLMRMDRPAPGQLGTFTIEALGPGYDVGDLTRGGLRPQVTISIAEIAWHRYDEPWWADLHVTRDLSPRAEHARRQARLNLIASHNRTTRGLTSLEEQDTESAAAQWLRAQGYLDLWRNTDPTLRVVRSTPAWFDVSYLIAATHPNRNWRCLVVSLSDINASRVVYWDIVDAAHKYATAAT